MEKWKGQQEIDLIAGERVRLKHGVLGQFEGSDEEVFQFLHMQAEQVCQDYKIILTSLNAL